MSLRRRFYCLFTIVPGTLLILIGLNAHAGNPVKSSAPPTVIERYAAIWERDKENIDMDRINQDIEDLKSWNPLTRRKALEDLSVMTRLDYGLEPPADRARTVEIWQAYETDIELASAEKVPKLLEARTWDNYNDRAMAALFLGRRAPHSAFLPLLKEVVANEGEDLDARQAALTAISLIPHESLIEYLIRQLDLEPELAFRAWQQLRKLTHSSIQGSKDDWQAVRQQYERWWEKNKADFQIKRPSVIVE